ncbi:TetR/AcrR family transcriptional regulator [Streptomyces griseorubiginosus]|uniref:TetR/AcrR family transcriptional regulator n=1 Tax=Streptomyces griseorubiginosus TaxID=67304 RepID=UPI0036362991
MVSFGSRQRHPDGERSGIRAPKQERSQRSFERVLDTALELLGEKGYTGFALTQVSRRSGVSIGSIYNRVDGKDDLLRAAQERFHQRMLEEHRKLADPERWKAEPLSRLVPALIADLALMLARNGRILGAFQQRGATDPEIATVGKAGYTDLRDRFTALLLAHPDEIHHPDPPRAVSSCFVTVYAALVRALALDTSAEAAEGSDLSTLVEDLGAMCLAFLLHGAED